MRIHKEGYKIILNSFLIIAVLVTATCLLLTNPNARYLAIGCGLILFVLIVRFFREPKREPVLDESAVIAPADGTIVIVKKVYEPEYLKAECTQVSIFMSVFNVHANWFSVNGKVLYYKYHPGRYLVAMHPKSSEKNERTTVVTERNGIPILTRQIAGYIARRIVCYAKEGSNVKMGDQMGFIKFGSRVDLFLPLESRIQVTKGQKVKALRTIIAKLPE
ncbi:MAG: phosphatidylserine decarboxylase family protein [Bacteroidales bacterium]|jgi:phosphatidylserine decarboxylase|nr:phosphatidylserine decarboxylase family protein [Bacteroidales bacterium]MDD3299614.1 phosphatidylserine decarboxylase family protein [Bacteroidales bacterium]MDD3843255.1 phosphatidylserine decarboxylase family protein [Bacteroidales bacterium]MDD4618454.1 phosphatidylserine decarboxylase family protein [Bacteroidales bacterium]